MEYDNKHLRKQAYDSEKENAELKAKLACVEKELGEMRCVFEKSERER